MDLDGFRATFPERRVDVAGEAWGVIDTGGPGPALLMLPGTMGSAEIFWNQIAALAGRLRSISVTYPAVADTDRLADGAVLLLDRLGIARAGVLGTSLGGFVAQVAALRHPARIDQLFVANSLVDPRPLRAGPSEAEIAATPADALRARMLEAAAAWPEPEPVFALVKALIAQQSAERITGSELVARRIALLRAGPIPPLSIPDDRIVIIDCDDDPLVPPPMRAEVRAHYPRAEAHGLPLGGHYPYITRAGAYTEILRRRLCPT